MITATAPHRTDYEKLAPWLDGRRTVVGASDTAGIFGVGYASQSVLTVWDSKVNGDSEPEAELADLFEVGHLIQPVVIELARRRLGLNIVDPGEFTIYRHPEFPWMGATLDGLTEDGATLIEAKNVSSFLLKEWQETDEPPLRVAIQLQHQMAVTGAERGYAVALVGGNRFIAKPMERNDRFIAGMIERLQEFWHYVETKTPPPVDGSEATARCLARLYPNDDGDTIVLPLESAQWDRELFDIKERAKELEQRRTLLENNLKAAIGPASAGMLPDGSRFTWKLQRRAEYVCKASEFRVLRRTK